MSMKSRSVNDIGQPIVLDDGETADVLFLRELDGLKGRLGHDGDRISLHDLTDRDGCLALPKVLLRKEMNEGGVRY
jgi:hypothetical protein